MATASVTLPSHQLQPVLFPKSVCLSALEKNKSLSFPRHTYIGRQTNQQVQTDRNLGRHAGGWCTVSTSVSNLSPLLSPILFSLSACPLHTKLTPESHEDTDTAHEIDDLFPSDWLAVTQRTHSQIIQSVI